MQQVVGVHPLLHLQRITSKDAHDALLVQQLQQVVHQEWVQSVHLVKDEHTDACQVLADQLAL